MTERKDRMSKSKKGQAQTPAAIRSRIVGEGMEAPDQLLANPQNWRRHPKEQLQALEGMLDAVGWVQRVIVNRTTGRLVDGHARVELALRRDEAHVPVLYVELSAEEERVVLAALDPLGGMAATDEAMLEELLSGLSSGSAELDAMLQALLADGGQPPGAGDGAPPGGITYQEKFAVLVECSGEAHQKEVFEKLQSEGYTVKVLVN